MRILTFTSLKSLLLVTLVLMLALLSGCGSGDQITTSSAQSIDYPYVKDELLLVLNNPSDEVSLKDITGSYNLVIRRIHEFRWGTLLVLGITDGTSPLTMSDILKKYPSVRIAEPNGYIYPAEAPYWPNDPLWESDHEGTDPRDGLLDHWDRAKMGADLVWNESSGAGVVVAHLDSGVRFTHEDIAQNIWINDDEIPGNGIDDDNNGHIDDWRGWDCINEDNDPWNPDNTHGTGGAGLIAGVRDNGVGIAGTAPGAKVMVVRCLGGGTWEDAAEAVEYAAVNGADIINMSFIGGYTEVMKAACDSAWDNGNGLVLMAASGNSDSEGIWSPANFPSVMAVGAVTQFNAYNQRIDEHRVSVVVNYLWGTSYGPELVLSAYGSGQWSITAEGDDTYGFYNGTSAASPMAAGVMALLMSAIPGNSAQWYWDRLKDTADDVQAPGFDIETGYGRVNALRAVYGPDRFSELEDEDGFVPLAAPESKVYDSIHHVDGNPYIDTEDLYKVKVQTTGILAFDLDIYTWGEDLDISVYSDKELTNLVAESSGPNHYYSSTEDIVMDVLAKEEYFIRVYSPSPGNSSSYILSTKNSAYFDAVASAIGPTQLPDGGDKVPFMKLELFCTKEVTLEQLNISKSGTIPLDQITTLSLYHDTNINDTPDDGEEIVSIDAPFFINRISLSDLNIPVAPDEPVILLVCVNLTAGLDVETLKFSFESYKDIATIEGYEVPYWRFPFETSICEVGS